MIDLAFETILLNSLINNKEYVRKALPYLKSSYFNEPYKDIFRAYVKYFQKYRDLPSKTQFQEEIKTYENISQDSIAYSIEYSDELFGPSDINNVEWLIDKTEKWCREQALMNALVKSVEIVDGKDDKLTKDAIPKILQDALSVGFDTKIGHNFLEDAEARYEFYHNDLNRVPFMMESFNEIYNGGVPRKTLNVVMAGIHVGKSLMLCSMASDWLKLGYNVLYITMEMSEEQTSERIDANLLEVDINSISDLGREEFLGGISNIKNKTNGNLIIKQYPTSGANVNHFKVLIDELAIKKNFVPDVVIVDYLNICASARVKKAAGSYDYIKSIAEELRGFAVENNVVVYTATQVNRTGYESSDPGMESTSESFGLPATADSMLALITNEELLSESKYVVKQLKNRFGNFHIKNKFVVGVNYDRMSIYDVNDDGDTIYQGIAHKEHGKTKNKFDDKDEIAF